MFSSLLEAMPPKGLPGVFGEKYWPACGGAPHASDAKNTNLVRARRQVERHGHISNITCGPLDDGHVIGRRFTEQNVLHYCGDLSQCTHWVEPHTTGTRYSVVCFSGPPPPTTRRRRKCSPDCRTEE